MPVHQDMVCITCPLGCRMELDITEGTITAVRHNSCKRGIDYAHQEFYDPRRMVTATAAIRNGTLPRIPVRTSAPLPMQHIPAALKAIYALDLTAPLDQGTVVITNVADSGIDILTTRRI
jgi:CxxC motif-containing protein